MPAAEWRGRIGLLLDGGAAALLVEAAEEASVSDRIISTAVLSHAMFHTRYFRELLTAYLAPERPLAQQRSALQVALSHAVGTHTSAALNQEHVREGAAAAKALALEACLFALDAGASGSEECCLESSLAQQLHSRGLEASAAGALARSVALRIRSAEGPYESALAAVAVGGASAGSLADRTALRRGYEALAEELGAALGALGI